VSVVGAAVTDPSVDVGRATTLRGPCDRAGAVAS
jgi:hypothetical protein